MNSIAVQVFNMIINIAMLIIFIRFMMQFAGMTPSNPYVEPAYKVTRIVDVFSGIFPNVGQGRISTSAIVLMLLIRLVDISGNAALAGQGYAPIGLFFAGSLSLVLDFLRMSRYLIMGSIIVSWIVIFTNSMHPIGEIIIQLVEPILAPFRRIIPNLGMLDLSPMIAFFIIYMLESMIGKLAVNLMPMVNG